MGQPIIVTMPDGQQVLTVPATDIAEETVISEEPPAKRQCMEIIENRVESAEIEEREALQKQLDEANREAQKYRQQLLKKGAGGRGLQAEAGGHDTPPDQQRSRLVSVNTCLLLPFVQKECSLELYTVRTQPWEYEMIKSTTD